MPPISVSSKPCDRFMCSYLFFFILIGCVIILGKTNMFRYNDPKEAASLRLNASAGMLAIIYTHLLKLLIQNQQYTFFMPKFDWKKWSFGLSSKTNQRNLDPRIPIPSPDYETAVSKTSQLSNLGWMPNSVSKYFDPAMKTGSSRQFKRHPTTYMSWLPFTVD